jgi:hypothetical protein
MISPTRTLLSLPSVPYVATTVPGQMITAGSSNVTFCSLCIAKPKRTSGARAFRTHVPRGNRECWTIAGQVAPTRRVLAAGQQGRPTRVQAN